MRLRGEVVATWVMGGLCQMGPFNGKHFKCVVPKCVRPCEDNMSEGRAAFFFVVAVRNLYDRKPLSYAVLRSYNVRTLPYIKFIWLLRINTLLVRRAVVKPVRPNPLGL